MNAQSANHCHFSFATYVILVVDQGCTHRPRETSVLHIVKFLARAAYRLVLWGQKGCQLGYFDFFKPKRYHVPVVYFLGNVPIGESISLGFSFHSVIVAYGVDIGSHSLVLGADDVEAVAVVVVVAVVVILLSFHKNSVYPKFSGFCMFCLCVRLDVSVLYFS